MYYRNRIKCSECRLKTDGSTAEIGLSLLLGFVCIVGLLFVVLFRASRYTRCKGEQSYVLGIISEGTTRGNMIQQPFHLTLLSRVVILFL